MDEVSQHRGPKPRHWTVQEQIFAEVASACGVSLDAIGRQIGVAASTVRRRLCLISADKKREIDRLYRKANLEKVSEYKRRWTEANPEKVREYGRRHRQSNPDKALERGRRWRNANREAYRAQCRQWVAANIDKARERNRKATRNNPESARERCRRRRAWRRSARRGVLIPVSRTAIIARFNLFGNSCAFCDVDAAHPRNAGRKRLTVDHALALAKGGLDEATNIIPACLRCNSGKCDRLIESWYRAQPFFTEARWRKIQRHCPAAVVGQLPLAFAA